MKGLDKGRPRPDIGLLCHIEEEEEEEEEEEVKNEFTMEQDTDRNSCTGNTEIMAITRYP
jgi:hypothetical protein